jgi:uncharacterized protein YwgA
MSRTSRLFASLSALDINPKMTTFAERKKVQKVVYLLDKVFGMHFNFSYGWYLHGPYSPEVTDLVFDVIEGREGVESNVPILSSEDKATIDRARSLLGCDIESNDKLELLVSLHFLVQCSKNSKSTQDDAINFLKSKKPYFTDEEIAWAIKRLKILEDQ